MSFGIGNVPETCFGNWGVAETIFVGWGVVENSSGSTLVAETELWAIVRRENGRSPYITPLLGSSDRVSRTELQLVEP